MRYIVILAAFYAGGAVSALLFTIWNVRLFGACGLLLGRKISFVVAKTSLLWPIEAWKFAFPGILEKYEDSTSNSLP